MDIEQIKAKLESIDQVLNEEKYDALNLEGRGADFLKKRDNYGKYMILEVTLEDENEEYTRLYLRGFEGSIEYHNSIATLFLKEVKSKVGDFFDLPKFWPMNRDGAERSLAREKEGIKLTITGLRGGRYEFGEDSIRTYGISSVYESSVEAYEQKLNELLGLLVKKDQYKDFKFKMDRTLK